MYVSLNPRFIFTVLNDETLGYLKTCRTIKRTEIIRTGVEVQDPDEGHSAVELQDLSHQSSRNQYGLITAESLMTT
jgi:hypothetical protein